ncbi:LysR family transcriptional regulator [Amycolatopsis nigrescens]|uniref:LysR family transcriptional regulator n=1 Tax=Amycolatopsis nigrescens TaxID=381445 RepID=UPI00036BE6DC|nr:LysR family transcriptional regulator [Amycolatopsis nigrescens]
MNDVLDIVPLRSLVAIADCGGFHRAATALHLTQSAVSQHVRRLEKTLGRTLVTKDGRGARFTADGEELLAEARQILAVHDEAVRRLGIEELVALVVGSTEHAADQLLPELSAALRAALPGRDVRFRLDRSARLAESVERGAVDLALLLGGPVGGRSRAAGWLTLSWYAAPDWRPVDGEVPVVVFDEPCVLRRMALDALADAGLRARIMAEAVDLAGVHAAARAGLGVTLLPSVGRPPAGLVPTAEGLPELAKAPLRVRSRTGAPPELAVAAAAAVRQVVG